MKKRSKSSPKPSISLPESPYFKLRRLLQGNGITRKRFALFIRRECPGWQNQQSVADLLDAGSVFIKFDNMPESTAKSLLRTIGIGGDQRNSVDIEKVLTGEWSRIYARTHLSCSLDEVLELVKQKVKSGQKIKLSMSDWARFQHTNINARDMTVAAFIGRLRMIFYESSKGKI